MTNDETLKLDELAKRAGTTPRTVRYYVQRGLLPAPAFHGRDTSYGREHLVRLRAIRRLQELYLPLDAIQAELATRSLAELERIAEGTLVPPGRPSPAAPPPPAPAVGEPARPRPESWRRYVLAPGLEIHLEEGADRQTRALLESLLEAARKAEG